jgi:hypothetical protein
MASSPGIVSATDSQIVELCASILRIVPDMDLVVYADFNCPFSALASHRLDVLADRDNTRAVEFRAVQHSPRIPPDGLAVVDARRKGMIEEVEEVLGLLTPGDGKFTLRVPEVLPNTATMCQSYATTPTTDLRRELFAAVWGDGIATSALTEDGIARQAEWQTELEGFGDRTVPTVVDDGQVIRGKDALAHLASLIAA